MRNLIRISAVLSLLLAISARAQQAPKLDDLKQEALADIDSQRRITRQMEKFLPELRKYYFDPAKFSTYLEQLGITYPAVMS